MAEYFKPDPSLFVQEKAENLAVKQAEKTDRLIGTPTYIPEEESGLIQNLVDLAQSSSRNEAALGLDAGKSLSNALYGTDFDDTRDTGYSNRNLADEASGVDPNYRAELNRGQEQVGIDLARGEYLEAAKNTAKVALPTLADSFGTILGIGAGSVASGGVGAVTGIKRKYDNVKKSVSKVKGLREVVNAGGHIADAVAKTSLITTTAIERKVHQYREENNGENPSAERVAVFALGSAITNSAQLGIIKKLYIPGNKQLGEVKSLVRTMKPDSSAITSIAQRIAKGAGKVAVAGGAEGVQEYLQTWDEILSVKVNPENGETLFQAVMKEVNNPKNQNEALTGGFLGAGAGGAAKGIGVVPAASIGAAVDATVGTTKTAFNTTKNTAKFVGNRSARNNLSKEEKRDLHSQYKAEEQIVANKTTSFEQQRKTFNKAKDYEDLISDDLNKPLVKGVQASIKLSDEQASTRAGVKQLKKALNVAIDNDIKKINKELESSNLAHFKSRSGRPNKKVSKPVTEEQLSTLSEALEPLGKETVQASQELESSISVDIVNEINQNPTEVSKKVLHKAKQLSAHDLERVAAITQKTNPDTAKALNKLARKKVKSVRRFTPSKNTVVNKKNIDQQLVHTAQNGITDNTHIPYISASLSSALGKKLGDAETVKTLQSALEAYKKHPTVKKQGKGVAHSNTIAKWEKRLKIAEAKLNKSPSEEVKNEKPKTKPKENATKDSGSDNKETSETSVPPTKTEDTRQKIKHVANAISLSIKDKVSLAPFKEKMPSIIKRLRKEGYNTRESFDALIKEFKGLAEDPEILRTLTEGLLGTQEEVKTTKPKTPSPDIQEDVTKAETVSQKQADDAYIKLFPGCTP